MSSVIIIDERKIVTCIYIYMCVCVLLSRPVGFRRTSGVKLFFFYFFLVRGKSAGQSDYLAANISGVLHVISPFDVWERHEVTREEITAR